MDIYTEVFLIFCGVFVGVLALGSIVEVAAAHMRERRARRAYILRIGAQHDVTKWVRR